MLNLLTIDTFKVSHSQSVSHDIFAYKSRIMLCTEIFTKNEKYMFFNIVYIIFVFLFFGGVFLPACLFPYLVITSLLWTVCPCSVCIFVCLIAFLTVPLFPYLSISSLMDSLSFTYSFTQNHTHLLNHSMHNAFFVCLLSDTGLHFGWYRYIVFHIKSYKIRNIVFFLDHILYLQFCIAVFF